MLKKKRIKEKGKLRLSEYFKKLKKGDKIAVVRELSQEPKFPKRLQGRSGTVIGERGKSYVVRIKDYKKEKEYTIKPIHLKRLK